MKHEELDRGRAKRGDKMGFLEQVGLMRLTVEEGRGGPSTLGDLHGSKREYCPTAMRKRKGIFCSRYKTC